MEFNVKQALIGGGSVICFIAAATLVKTGVDMLASEVVTRHRVRSLRKSLNKISDSLK